MSQNGHNNGECNSSGSSNSSIHGGLLIFQGDNSKDDLTLVGGPAPTMLSRTGTVRRVTPLSKKASEELRSTASPDRPPSTEKVRRSLDSTYRRSLESISEYKTIKSHSFSMSSSCRSRCHSRDDTSTSMDSPSSSDYTDFAFRSSSETPSHDEKHKTLLSPGSGYLSWIDSVQTTNNSNYFESATTSDIVDKEQVDNKVGEWNNFWLNYQSSRLSCYAQTLYQNSTNYSNPREKDDMSDARSTCSTHRDFSDVKNTGELITVSLDELNEALRCSQKVTEILQGIVKSKSETDFDESRNESSYYSQVLSQQNSIKEDPQTPVNQRERSFSYAVDAKDLQRQKQKLKPPPPAAAPSSSTSCINVLLNTGSGMADILKRVINKRREVLDPLEDRTRTPSLQSNCSEWSIK